MASQSCQISALYRKQLRSNRDGKPSGGVTSQPARVHCALNCNLRTCRGHKDGCTHSFPVGTENYLLRMCTRLLRQDWAIPCQGLEIAKSINSRRLDWALDWTAVPNSCAVVLWWVNVWRMPKGMNENSPCFVNLTPIIEISFYHHSSINRCIQ